MLEAPVAGFRRLLELELILYRVFHSPWSADSSSSSSGSSNAGRAMEVESEAGKTGWKRQCGSAV